MNLLKSFKKIPPQLGGPCLLRGCWWVSGPPEAPPPRLGFSTRHLSAFWVGTDIHWEALPGKQVLVFCSSDRYPGVGEKALP